MDSTHDHVNDGNRNEELRYLSKIGQRLSTFSLGDKHLGERGALVGIGAEHLNKRELEETNILGTSTQLVTEQKAPQTE